MISKEQLQEVIQETLQPYSLYEAYQKNGCVFPFKALKSKKSDGTAKSIPAHTVVTVTGFADNDSEHTVFTGLSTGGVYYMAITGTSELWRLLP